MTNRALDLHFAGPLVHPAMPASWTVVFMPDSKALLGTGNPVKVSGTMDGHSFSATLMPSGENGHFLSLNAALRKLVGKQIGDVVNVHLTERST
ncbi:DUF1905 domain-containing protein [Salinibacterium sp. PAMC 21357]|uniref:DUF1905 domain-containing protein n=1 Tax=Salinibacterium sp. PAMC 21357 TaxID=1112215 RepID=UPI000287E8F3|nr:DUF1905 domain-containing protein [Salinibacterium sp. PAMC 21357]